MEIPQPTAHQATALEHAFPAGPRPRTRADRRRRALRADRPALRLDDVPQRLPALHGGADGRPDGAADPRRRADGLERLRGLLPDRDARGIRLRLRRIAVAASAAARRPARARCSRRRPPVLPVHDPGGIGRRRPTATRSRWLLLLLAGSIGLPFFVLSTSASVFQHWLSRTDHPSARDPYFLYSASNLGCLLALASYPTVVEPMFTLREQARLWTIGYAAFVAARRRLRASSPGGAPRTAGRARGGTGGRRAADWPARRSRRCAARAGSRSRSSRRA